MVTRGQRVGIAPATQFPHAGLIPTLPGHVVAVARVTANDCNRGDGGNAIPAC